MEEIRRTALQAPKIGGFSQTHRAARTDIAPHRPRRIYTQNACSEQLIGAESTPSHQGRKILEGNVGGGKWGEWREVEEAVESRGRGKHALGLRS